MIIFYTKYMENILNLKIYFGFIRVIVIQGFEICEFFYF